MGTETNSSLYTITEQIIFNYLLVIFSLHSTTKFVVCEILISPLKIKLPVFSIQGPLYSNKIT